MAFLLGILGIVVVGERVAEGITTFGSTVLNKVDYLMDTPARRKRDADRKEFETKMEIYKERSAKIRDKYGR